MKIKYLLSLLLMVVIAIGCSVESEPEVIDETDPVGTVYLEEHFEKMIWGGDYIAQEPGIRGVFMRDEDDKFVINESEPTSEVTPGTDGSSEFFGLMAESYRILRGFEGWEGNMVYERPGYIKVSTATNRSAYVITPSFSDMSDEQANVEVSIKIARWNTASVQVYVEVEGGGTASLDFIDVPDTFEWHERTFTIVDATPDTQIKFVSNPNVDGRFFLHDLLVTKVE